MSRVRMEVRYAGRCFHPEAMVVRGAPLRPAAFPALFAILRHPEGGVALFDTGYTPRFLAATATFPASLYRRLTPMRLETGETAVAQLAALGIPPHEVRTVILSHFHADHIAGARDFPRARYLATREAYAAVSERGALGRLLRGFLPDLLPEDFEQRAMLLEPEDFTGAPVADFGATYDLFGDGSARLVRLPGHAAGQLGLWVHTEEGRRAFLVADAAWTSRSFRELRPPNPAANLIVDSARETRRTLEALHALSLREPGLEIIPSHCSEWHQAHAATPEPTRLSPLERAGGGTRRE
ncbi:MBL fold metallo-hydrolase [Hyalangium gracile]|uniref:MBL fold metallo-hydrolase n=1 Tax=Hyalangium gracile TaxID=394092 RepID=UPI001CCF12A8|nr:MBL fold metallo-hydrolase [Hyalangium gracile]